MVVRLNPSFTWGNSSIQFHGEVPLGVSTTVPAAPSKQSVSTASPNSAVARAFVHEYAHFLQSLVCPMGIRALTRNVSGNKALMSEVDFEFTHQPDVLYDWPHQPSIHHQNVGCKIGFATLTQRCPPHHQVSRRFAQGTGMWIPLSTAVFAEGMARQFDASYVQLQGAPPRPNGNATTEDNLYQLVRSYLAGQRGICHQIDPSEENDLVGVVSLLSLMSPWPDVAFEDMCKTLPGISTLGIPLATVGMKLAESLQGKSKIGLNFLEDEFVQLELALAKRWPQELLAEFGEFKDLCVEAYKEVLGDPLLWLPSTANWMKVGSWISRWKAPVVATGAEPCDRVCGVAVNPLPLLREVCSRIP